jgi:2,3-dihydroxybiphenyl 1,2-dioxygenase
MIESLSYIGFHSPRAQDWASFGPEILGAELAEPCADGAVRLRIDDAAPRITVHPAETDGLAYLGWEVAGPDGLAAAAARLAAEGIEVHAGSPDEITARSVVDLAWFVDPFGFRHELTWGLTHRPSTFRPGRAISGFVTGDGGLGHAVLIVPDLAEAERFYLGIMGFELSDHIEIGISIRFLHCNSRHHTLAFSSVPGMVGFHHLMLEVGDLDDVGSAYDLVRERDVPVAMDLGRHTNDLMTSFYLRTPTGFEIEYGCGGLLVGADHVPASFDAMSIWGHKTPGDALFPGILAPFEERSP